MHHPCHCHFNTDFPFSECIASMEEPEIVSEGMSVLWLHEQVDEVSCIRWYLLLLCFVFKGCSGMWMVL